VTGTSSLVLWQALERVYSDLGFDAVRDEAFRQLVLARITEPTSKADTVRVLEEIGVTSRTRETFMRCLSRVVERGYRTPWVRRATPTARRAGTWRRCSMT